MTLVKSTAAQLLAQGGVELSELLDALAAEQATPEVAPDQEHAPPVATVVPISDAQKKALRTVAARIEAFKLPDSPRLLTEAERAEAIDLYSEGIKAAKAAMVAAEEAFKSTFHGHLDSELGEDAPYPKDSRGHFIRAGAVTAPGLTKKISREERGGGAAPLGLADLEKLEGEGKISHEDLLGMTKQVRVIDPHRVMLWLQKKPELLGALAEVAKLTDKGTAMYVRPVKS